MQSISNVHFFQPSVLCIAILLCQQVVANDASIQQMTEEQSNTRLEKLPDITIQAIRSETTWLDTPASVYRIEQKDHQNNLGVNLTETLSGVPGLQLNNRENYAQDLQLSMRGFGARSTFGVRGVRLYVDGIPATMPDGQ